jgi:hypothetical protein
MSRAFKRIDGATVRGSGCVLLEYAAAFLRAHGPRCGAGHRAGKSQDREEAHGEFESEHPGQCSSAPEFLLLGCLVAMSEPAKVDGPPAYMLSAPSSSLVWWLRASWKCAGRPVRPWLRSSQNDWSKGDRIDEADRGKAASSSRGSAAAWSPAAQAPPDRRFLGESTHSAARRLAQRLRDV